MKFTLHSEVQVTHFGSHMTPEEMLKANAERVINTMSDHFDGMGYNRESVERLQGFVERQRSRGDIEPETISELENTLALFSVR